MFYSACDCVSVFWLEMRSQKKMASPTLISASLSGVKTTRLIGSEWPMNTWSNTREKWKILELINQQNWETLFIIFWDFNNYFASWRKRCFIWFICLSYMARTSVRTQYYVTVRYGYHVCVFYAHVLFNLTPQKFYAPNFTARWNTIPNQVNELSWNAMPVEYSGGSIGVARVCSDRK